jgi:hypothetical protein
LPEFAVSTRPTSWGRNLGRSAKPRTTTRLAARGPVRSRGSGGTSASSSHVASGKKAGRCHGLAVRPHRVRASHPWRHGPLFLGAPLWCLSLSKLDCPGHYVRHRRRIQDDAFLGTD